ncbi:DUF1285 domain-containing protein [Parasphingopyxis algicola]|uniref:DUF1285 domain-containing protein n=1 Tax=Parasphingopyxis algicola TaxID=2026624 RepID=UPI0015A17DEC|nr:DUF1285 domain-containing protein [Parasphingopyxis algicola]QLC26679.1 DUF1285 domain-containing protein [Parasphingopyxis algicola]
MAAPPDNLGSLSLDAIAKLAEDRSLPPVEKWHPEREGAIDIRIARDGTWYHEGDPINRPALVRLFSTILRREADGSHVLVTPGEKLTIAVDDAAFVAVEMKIAEDPEAGQQVIFRLNTGDIIITGPQHSIELRGEGEDALPYLHVRRNLWALLARPVYYELMERAIAHDPIGITSNGAFFPLTPGGASA